MYRFVCHIELADFTLKFLQDFECEKSWNTLTNTGTLKFTRKITHKDVPIQNLIKKGDKVSIALGYENTEEVFNGYVRCVKPTLPAFEIQLEDKMYLYKLKKASPKSWKNTNVSEILQHLNVDNEVLGDIGLGAFYIDHTTPTVAKVLDKIKDQTRLAVFVRNNKIVVGKQYDKALAATHKLKFNPNIISDNLEFKNKDDIKISVTAISNMADGSKIEVKVGDNDGDSRTLNYYNLSEADLKKTANSELDKLKYEGWRGSIVTFGQPKIEVGDIIELVDNVNNERSGTFWTDKVKTSVTVQGGYRQEITLGPKT